MTGSNIDPAEALALQRGGLRIAFDALTGSVIALGDERLGIELIGRAHAAGSWRLLVPMPDRRAHYVHGRDQVLRSSEIDGDRARLSWGPLKGEAGTLDIEVTLNVSMADGEVEFRIDIDNRSAYVVEEVFAPALGGIVRPEDAVAWRLVGPRVISGGFEHAIFDVIPSSYHGPGRSNMLFPYPGGWMHPDSLGMPWVTIAHPDGRAIYLGNHDPDVPFSAFWMEFDAEMRFDTGSIAALGSAAVQRWPDPADDPDASLNLAWVSFPFLRPGSTYHGPSIVVGFHGHGWRGSAARFRREFDSRLGAPRIRPTWLGDADAWLAIVMMFNDGTVQYRAVDLPHAATEAAKAGIHAILLAGWSNGGLDGGMPIYRVDPRLGTEAEFSEAMAACRALGVRIMVMAQVAEVNVETEWFRREGHRYVVQSPSGDPYYYGGVFYSMNTLLDQLGYSAPQIVTANPAHPTFREFVLSELEHIVDLGAHGVLLDKLNTGDPYSLDYAPQLPGSPSSRFHPALLATVAEFADRVMARDPEFAIAAESGWDRAMPYTEASYTRYFDRQHLPVQEVVFPEVRLTTTIVSDADRSMVNNALRYGHVMCLEPRYYHAGLSAMPNLVPYVGEALRVRRALSALLWDGRLADEGRADIQGDVLFSVRERAPDAPRDPDRALAVVINHFGSAARQARIDVPGDDRTAVLYRPFKEPEVVGLPVTTDVPAGEFLVVVPGSGHTV